MRIQKILTLVAAIALLMGCSKLNGDLSPVSGDKCRACHALPPADAVHAAHVDTMHYACDACHAGASDSAQTVGTNHGKGVVQVHIAPRFDAAGVSYFDPATNTCNLIYCHGNFLPGNPGVVKTTDTVTGCSFCHATPPVDRMHAAHIDTMHYTCDLCHPGDSLTAVTGVGRANHANGVYDVHVAKRFDSTGATFYDPATKTCNLSYCHGAVVPGDSGIVSITDTLTGCGFCHDLGKLRLVDHHVDSLIPISFFYKCGFCHPGYDLNSKTVNDSLHINGRIDIAGCDQCHELRAWVRKQ
jgi:hypothetical protein